MAPGPSHLRLLVPAVPGRCQRRGPGCEFLHDAKVSWMVLGRRPMRLVAQMASLTFLSEFSHGSLPSYLWGISRKGKAEGFCGLTFK